MILLFVAASTALGANRISPLAPLTQPTAPARRTYVAPLPMPSGSPTPVAPVVEGAYTPPDLPEGALRFEEVAKPIEGGVVPQTPESSLTPSMPEGGIVPTVPGQ